MPTKRNKERKVWIMHMKSVTFCAFLCGMSFTFAALAEAERKTYELYQDVRNSAEGGTAFENAKWWRDAAGNVGEDGGVPDAAGDYYSRSYLLQTGLKNELYFNCRSLHIGDSDAAGSLFVYQSGSDSFFGVGGEGLFLHRGTMFIQWKPVTLTGRITVESSAASPFSIQSAYPGTTNHVKAALCAAADKALSLRANGEGPGLFVVNLTGDCSEFYGTLKIGVPTDANGRTTQLVLNGTTLPGMLSVASTGLLELGSAASSVGTLTLADGATLVMGRGTLAVSDAFEMAGRVTVSGVVTNFANVAVPTVDFLTLPASAACDLANFVCAVTVVGQPATAALRLRVNEDGTKTLYAEIVRKTVYVSPTGDDGNDGTQAMPFRTLAHAVGQCAGGIIYALPGTYAEGVCDASETSTQSRVHLTKGTLLLSTDGAAVTTIVGARPTDGSDFGAGATRCARLDAGAVLQGFTLTGGFVYLAATSDYANSTGGGVLGCDGSVVLDCRITGNTAYRGGGSRGGAYVRCDFGENVATESIWVGHDVFGFYSSPSGGNAIGPTRLFDCLFRGGGKGYLSAYKMVELYNCTSWAYDNKAVSECRAYNCLFRVTQGLPVKNDFTRCVLGMEPTPSEDSVVANCAVANVALDENARPRRRKGAAIDAGDLDAYLAAWDAAGIDRAYFGTDYAGGPRVVNGQIDIGCGEFDRPVTGCVILFR